MIESIMYIEYIKLYDCVYFGFDFNFTCNVLYGLNQLFLSFMHT